MAVARATRKRDLPDFDQYVGLEKESLVRKIAHFLDWCAKNRPKEFIPYNQITFRIIGLKHMPRMQNSDVVLVQHSMSRVRPILQTEYKRTLISAPGVGVRATADNDDLVIAVAKSVRKMERDASRTAQLINMVDPAKLSDGPWKEWYQRQISGQQGLFKMITSNDWAKRVALPAPDEKKK